MAKETTSSLSIYFYDHKQPKACDESFIFRCTASLISGALVPWSRVKQTHSGQEPVLGWMNFLKRSDGTLVTRAILLKLFDPSYGFRATDGKRAAFLAQSAMEISKTVDQIKEF